MNKDKDLRMVFEDDWLMMLLVWALPDRQGHASTSQGLLKTDFLSNSLDATKKGDAGKMQF